MSRENRVEEVEAPIIDKNQLKQEKKKLKAEMNEQKKEAKRKAKELASQEASLDEEDSNWMLVALALVY